ERGFLGVGDVASLVQEDLIAATGLDADRDLVPHGAARHEESRLLAEDPGRLLLEEAHRRVFAKVVVADVGFGHRLAHRRGRPGYRVASQIDVSRCQSSPDSLNRSRADDSLSVQKGWNRSRSTAV